MRSVRMPAVLAVTLGLVALQTSNARAGEVPATPAQIQTWIKQLGNEDFQKREDARAALVKVGMPAMDALKKAKASEDNEVRNAASLLVAQLQWRAVPAKMDYLKLFPAETIFAMKMRDLDTFMKSSQQTAFLKLIEGPDLKPLADMLKARAQKGMGPALPLFQKWLGHFSGQIAGGVWAMNPMEPQNMRMALVAELKAESVEKVFQEFLAETQMMKGAIPTPINGLTFLKGPNEMGALALVGCHVVLGPNLESVRIVAENMLEAPPNALGNKASYTKALAASGVADPDIALTMDMQQYLEFLGKMGPQGPQMLKMMRTLGYDSMEFFLMTTRIIGDRFEDRFTVTLNDKPSKLMDLMKQFYAAEVDVKKALAPVPAEAIVAVSGYLDAAAMYTFMLDWVKEMAQLQGNVKPEEMDRQIAGFEQMTGIKLADLFATMKGNMAYWVELAPALAPPHLGFYMECPDAAKAQELAGYVGKYLDVAAQMMPPPGVVEEENGMQAVPPPDEKEEPKAEPRAGDQDRGQPVKPTFQKTDFKGHTIYTESSQSPLVTAKGREVIPYRLTWATHGNRIFFTSSIVQMQKRLTALDAGTPGLDPAKLLPPGQADLAAVKGLIMIDLKRGLDYGAKFGLPLLAAAAGHDKELQGEIARLGELAAEKSLFEGVPPLVAVGMPPKDGVLSTVMWTPAPYLPTMILGIGGMSFYTLNQVGAMGPGAVPAPAPPPNVKF